MKVIINIFSVFLLITGSGCGKSFLEKKPNSEIVIPVSLDNFQDLFNTTSLNRTPVLPLLATDDYYILSQAELNSRVPIERNSYVWNKDIYDGAGKIPSWNFPYQSIFVANSVLSQLPNVTNEQKGTDKFKSIEGQAYFIRASSYFDLLKCFATPYDQSTAATDPGVPLKLSPNIDEIQPRSSVQECYDQVISDLQKAAVLLPPIVLPDIRNRAGKVAAYALFARLYTSMRKYEKAELYADSCLALYNKLIDYNTVSQTATTPFTNVNDESIFYSVIHSNSISVGLHNNSVKMNIDTALLDSYAPYDLRRNILYITNATTQLTKTRNAYSGSTTPYSGLATDEIFLIKAECAARAGNKIVAMQYLNELLVKRFATGHFSPLEAADAATALQLVLKERRKELVWRADLRWDDLRRLNKEGAGITLTRIIDGKTITLPPNDPRYIFPIPDDEIALSGIKQNIR